MKTKNSTMDLVVGDSKLDSDDEQKIIDGCFERLMNMRKHHNVKLARQSFLQWRTWFQDKRGFEKELLFIMNKAGQKKEEIRRLRYYICVAGRTKTSKRIGDRFNTAFLLLIKTIAESETTRIWMQGPEGFGKTYKAMRGLIGAEVLGVPKGVVSIPNETETK